MTLDDLIEDFTKVHSPASYLDLKPYIQYIMMAYCMGSDAKQMSHSKPIQRSDGKRYISIAEAARKNMISERCIRRSMENNNKSAGYFWKLI